MYLVLKVNEIYGDTVVKVTKSIEEAVNYVREKVNTGFYDKEDFKVACQVNIDY
ncbi:hypothetical protein [Zhaonella formicivorans]|uniref:hypothetical protein n=1 Tax=Zhaonella formicivorans TaxID=2528593 RepID=UPI001D12F765|nr:hypothetical protein [Zhaonella formicivorans]